MFLFSNFYNIHKKIFVIIFTIFMFFSATIFSSVISVSSVYPAIEIAIIYYFANNKYFNYLHLFILGFIIDDIIYHNIVGVSSFLLIIMQYILIFIEKMFNIDNIQKFYTSVILFILYFSLFLLARVIFLVNLDYNINYISLLLYYIITIIIYPFVYFIFNYLINYYIKN